MKTLLALLLSLLSISFALAATAPKQPRVTCTVKVVNGNKQVDVSCKSKDTLKPGDVIPVEININSNRNYLPEAV